MIVFHSGGTPSTLIPPQLHMDECGPCASKLIVCNLQPSTSIYDDPLVCCMTATYPRTYYITLLCFEAYRPVFTDSRCFQAVLLLALLCCCVEGRSLCHREATAVILLASGIVGFKCKKVVSVEVVVFLCLGLLQKEKKFNLVLFQWKRFQTRVAKSDYLIWMTLDKQGATETKKNMFSAN